MIWEEVVDVEMPVGLVGDVELSSEGMEGCREVSLRAGHC